jgi:hypothetical protein
MGRVVGDDACPTPAQLYLTCTSSPVTASTSVSAVAISVPASAAGPVPPPPPRRSPAPTGPGARGCSPAGPQVLQRIREQDGLGTGVVPRLVDRDAHRPLPHVRRTVGRRPWAVGTQRDVVPARRTRGRCGLGRGRLRVVVARDTQHAVGPGKSRPMCPSDHSTTNAGSPSSPRTSTTLTSRVISPTWLAARTMRSPGRALMTAPPSCLPRPRSSLTSWSRDDPAPYLDDARKPPQGEGLPGRTAPL